MPVLPEIYQIVIVLNGYMTYPPPLIGVKRRVSAQCTETLLFKSLGG
jgi:hypothetical protein